MRNEIFKQFPDIKENEPLKNHCTYHIGGPAELFYEAKAVKDLVNLVGIALKNSLPYFILGSGGNVLFPDEGIKGLVIKNSASGIKIKAEKIIADSGTLLAKVILEAQRNNLTGLENLIGIPSTIGGAVFGNAGAFGTEIGDFVEKVEVLVSGKDVTTLGKSDLIFGYRDSIFKKNPNWVILRVYLGLKKGQAKEKTSEILKNRWIKHPKGYYCGSFFKNPSKDKPAGMLIEKCGLKGCKIGDAQISKKHANFILNLGSARASDVLKLAEMAKKRVKEEFGVELQEEVRVVR